MRMSSTILFLQSLCASLLLPSSAVFCEPTHGYIGINQLNTQLIEQIDQRIRTTLVNYNYINIGICRSGQSCAPESSYPPSPVIRSITWHSETLTSSAPGSDLWPVTWGPDGHIYTSWGDQGTLGIFDAPEPWGPWTTVAYYDNWLDLKGTGARREMLFINIPTKWISADGKTLWVIFTGGQDRFNLVQATLSLK